MEVVSQEAGQPVVPEALLEKVLEIPCPGCGGKLHYSAEKQQISCDYCGHHEDFDKANDRVEELSLNDYLQNADNLKPSDAQKHVYHCKSCGANMMLDKNEVSVNCSFCGSKNVNEAAFEERYIQPQGIIPFTIPIQKAKDMFRAWVSRGFFTPSKLKTQASLDSLKGVYIPFWTYDAQTDSKWSGYAGYYYYVTRTREVNGRTETYQERNTRWEWREGMSSRFFDDVLIAASKGLNQQEVNKIFPYRLQEIVNFDARLLLGWGAEVYSLAVNEGYQEANKIMDEQIELDCARLLAADTYRDLHVITQKSKQTFKHLLLPLWICTYLYNGKTYRFMVNGQTGKIEGSKPLSAIKIALTILLVLIILVAIYCYVG
jgi:DNA-directed RNA polymerase subunit RPC12/RpoP